MVLSMHCNLPHAAFGRVVSDGRRRAPCNDRVGHAAPVKQTAHHSAKTGDAPRLCRRKQGARARAGMPLRRFLAAACAPRAAAHDGLAYWGPSSGYNLGLPSHHVVCMRKRDRF
ncbi:hypothetical protein C9I57_30915 [Trinickia symbiotica]|uniref:Uncharacterized protein n=1 Tax=Trinickia symbiotica TaxID=863227 RepID=A0A2T3XKC9_9BURK|nr:hypothetical protein C9I57_30915 [Trinickia symbiotica]